MQFLILYIFSISTIKNILSSISLSYIIILFVDEIIELLLGSDMLYFENYLQSEIVIMGNINFLLETIQMQLLQSQSNLIEVEQTLHKNPYFSRSPLPGFADAVIFRFLQENKKYPDKKIYPNFYHWYIIISQFAESALEGWIREKRYLENQSQKCIMLISELFMNHRNKNTLRQSNRKKSLDTDHTDFKMQPSLTDSNKLKQIDLNFIQNHHLKAEYTMIVQLRAIENLEELFNKFYKFKIKIKELKFNKKQSSIFLKFITQVSSFEDIKLEIGSWIEVRHVISKMSKNIKETTENRRLMRTISIR